MTNFISIPVTSGTAYANGSRLIGVNSISGVFASGAAAVVIYTSLKTFTFTTSTSGAVDVLNAINAAIAAAPGGQVVAVQFPAGVTVTSVAVA
jgi:hypothetical protein